MFSQSTFTASVFILYLALNNIRGAITEANSCHDDPHQLPVTMQRKSVKKLIEDGIISQIIILSTNMFSTVIPLATLWFFDAART